MKSYSNDMVTPVVMEQRLQQEITQLQKEVNKEVKQLWKATFVLTVSVLTTFGVVVYLLTQLR